MKTLLTVLFSTFFTAPVCAGEEQGELDGKGLVCRRSDIYFSRPYYFVFENQRVLGPWVTIDTPLRIRKLQESEYQTTVSVVFWFGHTLWRDTLQLEGLVDGVRSVRYGCEIMDPRHMEVALQKKSKKNKAHKGKPGIGEPKKE